MVKIIANYMINDTLTHDYQDVACVRKWILMKHF